MARITVVIPTFQRPALLKRALRSVQLQSYGDFEVRVYDNASGDETAAVVEEIGRSDSRIKYFCHERNIGMVPNFVHALKSVVDSPFVSVLNDDDFILPNFFKTALDAFESAPEAPLFCGPVLYTNPLRCVIAAPLTGLKGGVYEPGTLLTSMRSHTWTGMLLRTRILESMGNLDVRITAADTDLLWRIASRYVIVFRPEPCGVSLLHAESLSTSGKRALFLKSLYRMLRKTEGLGDLSPVIARQLRAVIVGAYFRMALQAMAGGETAAALRAAAVLRRQLKCRYRGMVLQIVGGTLPETVFCRTFELAMRALSTWRRLNCRRYDELVSRALSSLDGIS